MFGVYMKRLKLVAVFLMVLNVSFKLLAESPPAPMPIPLAIEEGKQYQRLSEDVKNNTLVEELAKQHPNKIHVIEFFSYGCHWCYKLDPYLENWSKSLPNYVTFQRVPVEFQAAWRTLAKAYYTAEKLNAFDKIQMPLFDAIHTEKINNTSEETLREFFVARGITADDFNKAFDSFDVARRQKWAGAITRAYKVNAVPAIVIQGPSGIFLTTITMAGSEENLFRVIDHLIKLEKEAKK